MAPLSQPRSQTHDLGFPPSLLPHHLHSLSTLALPTNKRSYGRKCKLIKGNAVRSLDSSSSSSSPSVPAASASAEKSRRTKKKQTVRMNPTGILDEYLSDSSYLQKDSSSKEIEISTKGFAQFLRNRWKISSFFYLYVCLFGH